jgi:hypothetical protein
MRARFAARRGLACGISLWGGGQRLVSGERASFPKVFCKELRLTVDSISPPSFTPVHSTMGQPIEAEFAI